MATSLLFFCSLLCGNFKLGVVAMQVRDFHKQGPSRPNFAGSAAASGQGLLLVGDVGFEDHKTPEEFLASSVKHLCAVYSFLNVASLATLLKEQEQQLPVPEGKEGVSRN